jgi:hypothetical protein
VLESLLVVVVLLLVAAVCLLGVAAVQLRALRHRLTYVGEKLARRLDRLSGGAEA